MVINLQGLDKYNLGYNSNRTNSIVLYMSPYVENPRRERFHGISKIPSSCRKKLSRDFVRHGTQHNGKRKSPENGDHPFHHLEITIFNE